MIWEPLPKAVRWQEPGVPFKLRGDEAKVDYFLCVWHNGFDPFVKPYTQVFSGVTYKTAQMSDEEVEAFEAPPNWIFV